MLTALSNVLARLGDPREEEALAEALELLEAQPPGPELVAAYAQLASIRAVGGAYREAIGAAERALALAAELGLPEPARALGYRGMARANLGERQGLEDMRRALELAVEQGQGRAAAVLHNNLAVATWQYEGPQAALAACQEGIDFCERRGITEYALGIAAMSTTFLAELGRPEQALAEAVPVAERLEAAGDINFTEPRSVQLRLLAERGAHKHAPAGDELLATARESSQPQDYALAFSAAARLLLAQGHRAASERAAGRARAGRRDPRRPLLRLGAARARAHRARPSAAGTRHAGSWTVSNHDTPLFEHALSACRAQLAEAAGEHVEAAAQYAEAVERWHEFGNVPERAYALLGQGRCLTAIGEATAERPLHEARDLFASMGFAPAVAEVDLLLGPAEAAATL